MISRAVGADEVADLFAGFFVLLGAAFAERVDAAVDVGVVALVDAAEDFDHLPRPLRAGGVVEETRADGRRGRFAGGSESRRAARAAASLDRSIQDVCRCFDRSHELIRFCLTTEARRHGEEEFVSQIDTD